MDRSSETCARPSGCPEADGHDENPTGDPVTRRREQNRLAQRRFRWKQSQQKAAQRPKVGHESNYRISQARGAPAAAPSAQQLASPAPSSTNDSTLVSRTCDSSSNDRLTQANMTPSPPMSWEGLLGDQTASDLSGPEGLWSPSTPDFQVPFGTEDVAIDDAVEINPLGVVNSQLDVFTGTAIDQPWPSSIATVKPNIQYPPLSITTNASSSTTGADSTTTQSQPRIATRLVPNRRRGSDAVVSGTSSGWLGPLHLAAAKGRDRIIRVLLKTQSPDCDINSPDSDGMTALMHAVDGGFGDVAKSLLDAGAIVDQVDNNGRTALHWAVSKHSETLLRQLLQHGAAAGADLNVYNNDGQTPLHSAIDAGFELGVQLILEFGGDLKCMTQKF